jgi:hypothetical protein
MTARFDKHGLRFSYPENWEVHESYAENQALEIWVLAPSGAFWSLLAYEAGDLDGSELMKTALQSFDDEYEGFECEPANDILANRQLHGFDSNFFCLDLLVTNKMRTVRVDRHHWLIMSQAESREFESQEPVFDAITTSLLSDLGPSVEP